MTRALRLFPPALMVVCGLAGQVAHFSATVSGALFDPPTGSIRWIIGFPGGARAGPTAFAGLDDAWIAPDGRNAVAVHGGRIVGLRLERAGSYQSAVMAAAAATVKVVWSPDSAAAAVCAEGDDGLADCRIWQPDQPGATAGIPASLPYRSIRALALNAGRWELLAAMGNGADSGIYRIPLSGAAFRIAALDQPGPIALDSSEQSLYWLDAGARGAFRLRLDSPDAPVRLFDAAEPRNLCCLSVSADGGRMAVAGSAPPAISVYDLHSGSLVAVVGLIGSPERLLPLPGGGWHVVAHRGPQAPSALLFDFQSLSAWFVPADPREPEP